MATYIYLPLNNLGTAIGLPFHFDTIYAVNVFLLLDGQVE